MNEGDWICSDSNCGNINFARRVSCYRCNKEKPDTGKASKKKLGTEIGKSAAEKSRGLFNADDWQCNKCANVNWARRQTCNVCNAPKFGEVEARTGYGGGYNERGVVEYRRREPSSEDEYDEFGRKRRKRKDTQKSDNQDKVGTTEGPVFKKLPPTMLPKGKMDHVTVTIPPPKNTENEKITGSLSDGSVCELPPLNKMAFRRHQVQSQTSYNRHDPVTPKTNGLQSRKRHCSSGDKDQAASSGYETGSKRGKRDSSDSPGIKCSPVMENRVSSTNNDVVYKFTGPTPAESYQVTYTVEERVRAAAFAIVYNNCRISTEKFQTFYDKPAPDFKTIFGWRQCLLTTGCLVDTHLDSKNDAEKPSPPVVPMNNTNEKKNIQRNPNPDEILISLSDSEDDKAKTAQVQNKYQQSPRQQRSVSVETLLICGVENEIRATGSSISTIDDRVSQTSHQSRTSLRRSRSKSCDSQDSNYPDTDSENVATKLENPKPPTKTNVPPRQSVQNSDSDSVSYNSEDDDFLSRVYKGKKSKRKFKRRNIPVPPSKIDTYVPETVHTFQGYTTVKPLELSPLVAPNIYTSNFQHMNVKRKEHNQLDYDGCSSEYIPTRLASTAKMNYQKFKDKVKKKGFWAKANGQTISNKQKPKEPVAKSVEIPLPPVVVSPCIPQNIPQNKEYASAQKSNLINQDSEFANDDFKNFMPLDPYSSFDKLASFINETPQNTSSVFDMVQSSSTSKNKSIMDIFDTSDIQNSLEGNNDLEKCDNVQKRYETEWDDDDEALYKDTETSDATKKLSESPPNIGTMRSESPTSNMLYVQEKEVKAMEEKTSTPNKITMDVVRERRDKLLGLLDDFQATRENDITDIPLPTQNPENIYKGSQSLEHNMNIIHGHPPPTNLTITRPEAMPMDISNEIIGLSEEHSKTDSHDNTSKKIPPSKKVQILEEITIKPHEINEKFAISRESKNVNQNNANDKTFKTNAVQNANVNIEENEKPVEPPQTTPVLDLSNLLSGINTNTLLLALQNLQQLSQNTSTESSHFKDNEDQNQKGDADPVETINLTNDEEWEKESNRDGSIERQLEQMDGNTGDTPFLSDIFDPGPVMPSNAAKKLNINIIDPDEKLDDNAPVIGNFKSFALPKPILLNRLKLTVKTPEKISKKSTGGKRIKRKKKSKASSSKDGEEVEGEGEEEEESGDEADLSKYDLWGSDEEQGSSKTDGDKTKEGDSSKEDAETADKNGKSASPDTKSSKRRSRSSSSSSSSTSSSSSSHSSTQSPKNKFDDFNLNSEREGSPRGRGRKSRSRSPRSRSANAPQRRKSRDSRSAGESRSSKDKERSRDRERRDRSRGSREHKERRYSREGANHYGGRGRHR